LDSMALPFLTGPHFFPNTFVCRGCVA
jgi:hypothetical protein